MATLSRPEPRTPREVFDHMQLQWLDDGAGTLGDLLADDAVVEMPFAAAGPTRIQGRQQFLDFAAPQRAALPVRFEAVENVVVHDTADPEVIVVEYELHGTVTTTGRRVSAPFIGVLRVRGGRIAHWREYQDSAAIARALQP